MSEALSHLKLPSTRRRALIKDCVNTIASEMGTALSKPPILRPHQRRTNGRSNKCIQNIPAVLRAGAPVPNEHKTK